MPGVPANALESTQAGKTASHPERAASAGGSSTRWTLQAYRPTKAAEIPQARKKATQRRPLFPRFGSGSAMPAMNIATRAGLKTTSGSIEAPRVGSRSEKGAYGSRTRHESA